MPSPRVDFYIKEDQGIVACQLLETLYKEGQRIYVHCRDKAAAEWIDELLWTFQDDSFIPHNLHGEGPKPPPPIQIGYQEYPQGFAAPILMNLSLEIPSFYSRYKQILEVVAPFEAEKEQARLRYKQYRSYGCELHYIT